MRIAAIAPCFALAVLVPSPGSMRRAGTPGDRVLPAADECAPPPPVPVEGLLAAGRYWHVARVAPPPAGSRTLPAESLLAPALAAEGLGQLARVDELLRRARGGDSLPAFVALAARADERSERWHAAEARYRRLLALPATPDAARAAASARLALVLERSGQRDSAAAAWRRAAAALPEIADWFALRRAELETDTTVAFAIISGSRSPGAVQRGQLYVARRRLEAGDLLGALDIYRRYGRPLDIARVEFMLGHRRQARARADSLLFAETTRPMGLLAANFLNERFDSLRLRENLAVARAFSANRDLATAERYLRAAIRAADTSIAAWLQLAELSSARRDMAAALRAVDSAGARARRRSATLIARARVGALLAGDAVPQADSLLRNLVRIYRGDSNIAASVLSFADRHRARGEYQAERSRYVVLLSRFGATPAATVAAFRFGLMLYAQGLADSAAGLILLAAQRDTQRLLGLAPRYWEARLRLEGGDSTAPGDLRRMAAESPISFAGTRARELLGDSVLMDRGSIPLPAPGSFPPARARERIRLLAGIGFDIEARAEASGWASDTTASIHLLIAAAGAAGEAGYARESIALGEAARARVGMVPGVVRALFPYSYRSVIEAEAAEHCLDPLLLAALIRQESRFDPRAVSRAGARGIGQVLPATGQELARRLRLGPWDAELLFAPDFNLHLGARYLYERATRDSFPTHALLASYNAGRARVNRWRGWPEFLDPDLFVERVSIAETRDYVRTVYASYTWYRQAYGGSGAATPPERPLSPLP